MAEINLTDRAAGDYIALDGSVRIEVRKAVAKLEVDPRAYGEPLGKKAGIDLFGFYSIRAGRRIRLVYSIEEDGSVLLRVIGRREGFEAHRTAEERIRVLGEAAVEELHRLEDVLKAVGDDGQ